jgi:hypothetical protein
MQKRTQKRLGLGGVCLALVLVAPPIGAQSVAQSRAAADSSAGRHAGKRSATPTEVRKFFSDDPIQIDHDNLSIERPSEIELSGIYDVIENSFGYKPGDDIPSAVNVNTLGEVPDSSWFTNRIGVREMSLAELVRGPARTGGPDLSEPLTVIAAKTAGISPGFTVRDSRGDVYFMKFDPQSYPNLSTAVDVIASKFFHAMGYNVPENYIALIDPDNLQIEPGTEVVILGGHREAMIQRHLDEIFTKVARLPDGRARAIASLRISGDVLGPFKFYGVRSDDPNDIFPHQHRRELRGYRVFCAWLNHDDSRSINSLDVCVEEGGRSFLEHYLIDFASALGAGSDPQRQVAPQNPRSGNEYLIEFWPAIKTAMTLGIWERPWMNVKYAYPEHSEIGRIESDFFDPLAWKAEYRNPAFARMLPDDAFWAAKIVSRFSDEAIRALVETGEYSDPTSEEFLSTTLIERRDKIIDAYFRQVNPLDGFRVVGQTLEFENLGEQAGLAGDEAYEFEWFTFDNNSGSLGSLAGGVASQPALPLPDLKPDARANGRRAAEPTGTTTDPVEFLMVRIRTRSSVEAGWLKAVEVYLRTGPSPEVVGIDREI